MRRARRKTPLSEAEMNLTPLIDVCFVVLIMFIVVAPLLERERVDLAMGPPLDHKSALALQEKSPLTIHVHADDSIVINKKAIAPQQLKEALYFEKIQNPSATPQLFHDKQATFGTYQRVKNAVAEAGFKELDLILKPQ